MDGGTWVDKGIEVVTVWIPQLVTIASIVVRLTPTPVDDGILAGILAILGKVAINPNPK